MIHLNDRKHGFAIAVASECIYNPVVDVVISRTNKEGEILGGVIFDNYTHRTISVHVVGFHPNWMNIDFIWATFNYAFVQAGCDRIFAQVKSNNEIALEYCHRMGFKELLRVDEVFPDADLVVLQMRREGCRWLNLKPRQIKEAVNGQAEATAAA